MSISIDTNILVYSVDANEPAKQSRALHIIASLANNQHGVLTDQAIFEFVTVATRKGIVTFDVALTTSEFWVDLFPLVLAGPDVTSRAFNLMRSHQLNIWDARLLGACGGGKVSDLLSEDMQDGGQYGPVRVLNPFNSANDKIIRELLK